MAENKMKTKYVKYDYVLNEMIDDMTRSIENVKNAINGQVELIKCLEKENNPKFKGFIDELDKTNAQYNGQIKILNHRIECAKKVKHLINMSEDSCFILSMLLEAFGVANKEAKTIDEREKNKEEIKEIVIDNID